MKIIQKYYYKSGFPPRLAEGNIPLPYCEEVQSFEYDKLKIEFNYVIYIIRNNKTKNKFVIAIKTLWPNVERISPFDTMIEDRTRAMVYSKNDNNKISTYSSIMMKLKTPVLRQRRVTLHKMNMLMKAYYTVERNRRWTTISDPK